MRNVCYYSVEKLLSSRLLSKNLKVRIYKTVILPVVLYSCETWTLTLREGQRLREFENKVLRETFRAKRDEVTGKWRKLHNAELHSLYFSPDIIRNIISRRLRWAGHVIRMGESKNAYRVLVGRSEGKRSLGRPRRRWEDNIKMDLRAVGYDDRDRINLAQGPMAGLCDGGNESPGSLKAICKIGEDDSASTALDYIVVYCNASNSINDDDVCATKPLQSQTLQRYLSTTKKLGRGNDLEIFPTTLHFRNRKIPVQLRVPIQCNGSVIAVVEAREMADVIYYYGLADGSNRQARVMYAEGHPGRRI
ncbi:hypothetical protein ANN_12999 [Periplaneta americana]|uniref:Uncharacterized protein n=1 Tax=Periplaneta americana TaxID=6978 RepID=A0ABQ8TI61_PERAM|nr:hypothetical protein ANN_12999 [Periplaneta americana]